MTLICPRCSADTIHQSPTEPYGELFSIHLRCWYCKKCYMWFAKTNKGIPCQEDHPYVTTNTGGGTFSVEAWAYDSSATVDAASTRIYGNIP